MCLNPSASLPVQGAWIEILRFVRQKHPQRRSPCRERGLKCKIDYIIHTLKTSLPVQGAWIEIARRYLHMRPRSVAPRAGSVD